MDYNQDRCLSNLKGVTYGLHFCSSSQCLSEIRYILIKRLRNSILAYSSGCSTLHLWPHPVRLRTFYSIESDWEFTQCEGPQVAFCVRAVGGLRWRSSSSPAPSITATPVRTLIDEQTLSCDRVRTHAQRWWDLREAFAHYKTNADGTVSCEWHSVNMILQLWQVADVTNVPVHGSMDYQWLFPHITFFFPSFFSSNNNKNSIEMIQSFC